MGHDVCDDAGDGDNGNKTTSATTQTKGMVGMLHIAGVVESVTFQFKKMGAKEWKRSHKSNRELGK
jgi:hypothetical protein